MMTDDELALVQRLGDCYTEYVRMLNAHNLDRYGTAAAADRDHDEFASRVHGLQARVMWLAARRAHPDRLR